VNRREFHRLATAGVASTLLPGCRSAPPALRDALPQSEIGRMSAAELTAAYSRRALSPAEATRAILARIDASRSTVNAYSFVDERGALEQARASEARWLARRPLSPLDGVPVGIKDQYQVAGWPQRFGSRLRRDDPYPREDEEVIARLRRAGCVLLGKTTQPEEGSLSMSASGLSGVTRNPRNLSRTTGGSSSGAGAAAAAGLGPIQMAADGGGSIREPAAYCGVFGFKPTDGVIPRAGNPEFAVYGPIVAAPADMRLAMRVAAGAAFDEPVQVDLRQLRVGYMPYIGDGLQPVPDVRAVVDAKISSLRAAGLNIELLDPVLPYGLLRRVAASFYMQDAQEVVAKYGFERVQAETNAVYARFVEVCAKLDPEKVGKEAEAVFPTFDAALSRHPIHQYDVVLAPAMPTGAYAAEAAWPPIAETLPDARSWMDEFGAIQAQQIHLVVGSYMKLAEAALPCGVDGEGLPVGMIASAKSGQDTLALAVAEKLAPLLSG
jgi:aspartyl-tRNA(Asn)/glutamyl-tRNA(Gln) amidotransferase subunit A